MSAQNVHTQHEDIGQRLHRHDREISALRTDIAGVQATVVHLEKQTDLIDRKIDRYTDESRNKFDAILQNLNRQGRTTIDDIAKWLQVAVLGGALVGGTVSAIVYVSGNLGAADMAVLKYRLEQIHGAFGWQAEIKREQQ